MATRELNAIVSQRIEVTPELIKLRVIPDGWELPDFTPGQYCTLGLPGTAPRHSLSEKEESPPKDMDKMVMRAYSIASSSVAKEYLELYVGLVRSGSLSTRLFELKVDDRLYVSPKFKGMFTLSQVPHEHSVVLIATGTGVAPYMSMIRTEISTGLRRRFAVFHGAYHSSDLGYHSELQTLDAVSNVFSYVPTLSHAHEERVPWRGREGFVQKLWTGRILDALWGFRPEPENTHAFLCGHPMMIEEMEEILQSEGFKIHSKNDPGQIHSEKFFVKL